MFSGIVSEASRDAGGLNLLESFRAAFSVNVLVHNLLRGLRETRSAAAAENDKPKSQKRFW